MSGCTSTGPGCRAILRVLCCAGLMAASGPATGQSEPLEVPDGFQVTLYADDDLAHDIFSMTIDSKGRVVVAGAGYVRILVDSDDDGRADRAINFADAPKSGAQGMFFYGNDLLCTGDGGLLRFRDADGDGRADGPPVTFLKFKTGGEHDVHSIQRGPDSWWYLIAGNYAGITGKYATLPTSPVKQPLAGTFFRLKPDLTGGEIVAHGFRNAYDFCFNSQGDAFTCDSDGERDVSLPWYRPTRVFQMITGSHAGWVTRSWKQPDAFADMPPVMARFGRGSPTGVVCYQHSQFPAKWRDSLFVLDWTYGRVLNVGLKRDGASYESTPTTFMTGVGQFGFAPTDIEVGQDGSLYVSVGGRGTRGGVYRIRHRENSAARWPRPLDSDETKLDACLTAPQPLSSWSRAVWEPLARALGAAPFSRAAADSRRSVAERLRAIEILTAMFDGLDDELANALASDASARVRARTAWSLGRTGTGEKLEQALTPFLNDDDPLPGRVAAEALIGQPGKLKRKSTVDALTKRFGSDDRFDHVAAARLGPQLETDSFKDLSKSAAASGWQATTSTAFASLGRQPGYSANAFRVGLAVLEGDHPLSLKREVVRLMQLGLGDLTPKGRVPAVFDGYAPQLDLRNLERQLDPHRIRLAGFFPTGDERLDYELARLLAMLQPFNPELLTRVLEKITSDSHPKDDLHYLIVAARVPASRDGMHRKAIARAFVGIDRKMAERKLNQDSNWDDRLGELYAALVELDPLLPDEIVAQPGFGLPGHVLFMSRLPADLLPAAVDAFVKQAQDDGEYAWSNDVVFVIGESKKPEHRKLIRNLYEDFSVRNSVLVVLSRNPEAGDRQLFIQGLESSQTEVLTACLTALAQLPASDDAQELVALMRCLRRLGADRSEYPARNRVVRLLRRNTRQQFGWVFGKAGENPQREAVQRWTKWMTETHPQQAARMLGTNSSDLKAVQVLMSRTDWSSGEVERGRRLFEKRSCAQCHGGRRALGPDLSGAAGRFSRDDLFTAIVLPNRDVSNRYQTTMIATNGGKVYTGLVIYESVDGLILRNSTNQTIRIESDDIDIKRRLPQSLMPAGLLKGMKPQDLADLYAYLRSLRR